MNQWLEQKEKLVLDITNHLIEWDGSAGHAVQILSDNDEKFKQLNQLDRQISAEELNTLKQKNRNHWQKLINTQHELMQSNQAEQVENQEQLAQIDNKEKVVKNYMSVKNKSIFIEKDY